MVGQRLSFKAKSLIQDIGIVVDRKARDRQRDILTLTGKQGKCQLFIHPRSHNTTCIQVQLSETCRGGIKLKSFRAQVARILPRILSEGSYLVRTFLPKNKLSGRPVVTVCQIGL